VKICKCINYLPLPMLLYSALDLGLPDISSHWIVELVFLGMN